MPKRLSVSLLSGIITTNLLESSDQFAVFHSLATKIGIFLLFSKDSNNCSGLSYSLSKPLSNDTHTKNDYWSILSATSKNGYFYVQKPTFIPAERPGMNSALRRNSRVGAKNMLVFPKRRRAIPGEMLALHVQ